MKIQQQVLDEPNANPVPNLGVRVRRKRDGVTLATVTTDADGFALIQGDGHYPPFFLQTTNQIGGPRIWSSNDTIAAGAISPAEVVYALRAFGDGYIPGFLDNLAVSLNSTMLSLATGGALVAGYPVINYTADTFALTRPSSGTRVDRLVVRVYGEDHEDHGMAEFAILAGTVGGGTPSLTQTDEIYEVSLATVTVPSAGSLTLVDDRVPTLSVLSRKAPVTGVARAVSVSTSDTGGVSLLSLDLSLTENVTYDIEAKFAGYQASVTSESYPHEYSYGSFGAGSGQFKSPYDIAFAPNGSTAYIADYGNNRIVRLSYAAGALTWVSSANAGGGMSTPSASCVDGSGNVYHLFRAAGAAYVVKDDSTGSTLASVSLSNASAYGIATDNTHIYITNPSAGTLEKRLCSTLAFVSRVSGWGPVQGIEYLDSRLYIARSNGYISTTLASTMTPSSPNAFALLSDGVAKYGIATDGADLYYTEASNQIKKITTDGTALASFGTYGSGDGQLNAPRGITVDPAGDIWVADTGNNRVQRFGTGTVLGGYGEVAVAIDGNVSTYAGMGALNGAIGNAHTRSVSGPATVTVAGYGKATADTIVLNGCVLSARAVPRL